MECSAPGSYIYKFDTSINQEAASSIPSISSNWAVADMIKKVYIEIYVGHYYLYYPILLPSTKQLQNID